MRTMIIVRNDSIERDLVNSSQLIMNERHTQVEKKINELLISRKPKRPNILDRIRAGNLIDEDGNSIKFDNAY